MRLEAKMNETNGITTISWLFPQVNQFHILQREKEQMSDINYNNIIIVSTCYRKHK